MATDEHPRPLDVFLVPSPRLGRVEDIMPERVTAGMNEWITLSRDVLVKRRAAAAEGKALTPPEVEIGEDHNELRPFGAQYCPALQEINSIGWVVKWPANAVFRRVSPKLWEIVSATDFYKYHAFGSFVEIGEAETFTIDLGWIVATPPGFSTLIKNLPNNLSGYRSGMRIAEGVLRTDMATVAIQVHAFLEPNAPREITVTRGDPCCILFPFRREGISLSVMNDAESVEAAGRYNDRDEKTYKNAPGRYRALYVDEENPSALYPRLEEIRAKQREAAHAAAGVPEKKP